MNTNENSQNRFSILQPDWVQLSPYGDFPHARGLQRVDLTAAETMVRNFDSFLGRAGRLFGGVPFYIGHPDLPGASESADKKAYGWITKLEARADGLFGRVKWSEPGEELLRNGHFKFFSPYWEAEEIGFENGKRIYRPIILVSVGLTNQPNIPVNPLANEQGVILPVDFGNHTTGQPIPLEPAAAQPDPSVTPQNAPAIRAALANALSTGRILPADLRLWRIRLENDFASASAELTRLAPILHVRSCTEQVRFRREELALPNNRRATLQDLVRRKMRDGLSYDEAWQRLKQEKPHLFESVH